ncbi:pyridoxamine 5'-phosphate oxidase family protein [Elioraea sp.]|uniref:pyridoxamine 5'-phosphate oxidase family protein n=1 Tax=Elioraea sp. TaxID=2185103 RepID=UPI003F714573
MDETLEEALASAWALLVRAAGDPRHPCRVVQLATNGSDGAPQLRSVILRGVDPASRVLRLHTDRRSAKVAEITAAPRVALLAWEPRTRVQLRLVGGAETLTDGPVWQAAWQATPAASRRDYAQASPPGTPCHGPPAAPGGAGPARNFAVILFTVDRLDWLRLAPGAHRRAGFASDGDVLRGTWLVP